MTDLATEVAIDRALDALGAGLRALGRAAVAPTDEPRVDVELLERIEEIATHVRSGHVLAASWACVMSPIVGGGLLNGWAGDSREWPALATVTRNSATRIEQNIFCGDDDDDEPDEDA
jgi:hypothetical protein